MARYIIPSITISAIYGAYKSWWDSSLKSKPILSLDEAVNSLNLNQNTNEALKYVLQLQDKTFLTSLSPSAVAILARSGSDLCNYVPVKPTSQENIDVTEALRKYNLGDKWNSSLEWINRVACSEEDLSCNDEWLVRMPSQVERLRRMLQLLFLTTEQSFNADLIDIDIVHFLFNIYNEFITTNEDIALLTLKIMSNMVASDEKYAKAMLCSEWVQLLANMVTKGKNLMEKLISHKICQNALSALGTNNYRLRSDIYEVHTSESEPELDIILIHGLRGNVAYTWRQKDSDENILTTCWPKDWLPLDIKRPFRIIGLDYPSYIFQFSGAKHSIQSRADRFKNQLRDAGIGKRPTVFICHSMGGLLAKRLILDCPELMESTVGILFIATPHKGSPVASWGYSFLLPTDDVLLLNESNPVNKKLNEDFSAISKKIPVIVSMVETKESNLIGNAKGIVVPTKSAVFDQGAVYHIEEAHLNVCKPSARECSTYGVVLNFMLDCFREVSKRKKS
ncbi:unnamed protein product [Caenorhabditis bovis]|uniref:GPI inositol-deacylase n=1 Tax=Caenorhabditis bovis TaxID=2654633 RepID=A0A8S1EJ71_9PELO|nr:unnamed protein product [Caenorhabditis bovis]